MIYCSVTPRLCERRLCQTRVFLWPVVLFIKRDSCRTWLMHGASPLEIYWIFFEVGVNSKNDAKLILIQMRLRNGRFIEKKRTLVFDIGITFIIILVIIIIETNTNSSLSAPFDKIWRQYSFIHFPFWLNAIAYINCYHHLILAALFFLLIVISWNKIISKTKRYLIRSGRESDNRFPVKCYTEIYITDFDVELQMLRFFTCKWLVIRFCPFFRYGIDSKAAKKHSISMNSCTHIIHCYQIIYTL